MATHNWDTFDTNRILTGETQAVNEIYSITKPYFLWFFKGDEELFHDTILAFIKNIHRFNPEKPLHKWLLTIGINLWRSKGKKKKIKTITLDEQSEEVNAFIEFYSENTYTIDQRNILEKTFDELTDEEKTFVEWYLKTGQTKEAKNRMKFSRIIKKMRESVTKSK